MNGIRDYLLSVCCAALLCSVVGILTDGKSAASKLIKLLSGVFLATVMLKPVISIRMSDWKHFESDILEKSKNVVAEGERVALEALEENAAQSAKEIVQQEAEKLGCILDVTVYWEGESPKEIMLKGAASPYAKNALSQWLTENMGLSREAQIWIG